MNEDTMWSWCVKGTEGVVGIMEKIAREGVGITQNYHEELTRLSDRFADLVIALDSKVKDRQA